MDCTQNQTKLQQPTLATSLTTGNLVAEINAAHEACCAAAKDTLQHAMRVGDLLAEAKSQCPHGQWQTWIDHNFKGPKRSAQVYMQLGKGRSTIESKAQGSALLTITSAIKLIEVKQSPPPRYAILLDNESVWNCWGMVDHRLQGLAQITPSKQFHGYHFLQVATFPKAEGADGSVAEFRRPLNLCEYPDCINLVFKQERFVQDGAWFEAEMLPRSQWEYEQWEVAK